MAEPHLDDSLGAIELGIVFSTALYGVVFVQCYTYYQAGFKDSVYLKALIVFVLLVETLHTVVLWVYLYHLTVTNFGNYEVLQKVHWTIGLSVPLTTLITCCVQSFFAVRVYRFSKRIWYTLLSCALSIVRLGTGIAIAVLALPLTLPEFVEKYTWLIITSVCVGDVVDIGNTIAICYCLNKAKHEVVRSQRVLDRLIRWSIETGFVTSVCVTVMLIMLVTMDNLIWMFFLSTTAKFYSNSLLASLNGRIALRAVDSANSHITLNTIQPTTLEFRRPDDSTLNSTGVRVDVVESRSTDGFRSTKSKKPNSNDDAVDMYAKMDYSQP